MSRIAYIDGCFQPLNWPAVMIEDRGYQFADGVYEVLALRDGRLCEEDLHLERLAYSLEALAIAMPMSRAALKLVVRETVRQNRLTNGIVYIQISRGVAPREHGFKAALRPVLVVTVRRFDKAQRQRIRREGIAVISMPDQRWARCDIKSIALLPNVLARQSAIDGEADEAWLTDDKGYVTEGAATNAWIVDKKGCLHTRSAGAEILNGIMRRVLLDLATEQGLKVSERPFTIKEARIAAECFSTASTMAVLPVVSIDGQRIGDGKPGAITTALAENYDRLQGF